MKTQNQIQTLPPIESTSLIITLANSTQTQLNFGPNPTQIHTKVQPKPKSIKMDLKFKFKPIKTYPTQPNSNQN